MKLRTESSEVYFMDEAVADIRRQDIEMLKAQAQKNQRQRARICVHQNVEEAIHEMLLAVKKGAYLPPHRHLNKAESYHIVEGRARLLLFGSSGRLENVIPMGEAGSGRAFYCRVPKNRYHSFHVLSDFFVLHETTNGPFDRSATRQAPWAPKEGDAKGVLHFRRRLLKKMKEFSRPRLA